MGQGIGGLILGSSSVMGQCCVSWLVLDQWVSIGSVLDCVSSMLGQEISRVQESRLQEHAPGSCGSSAR